MIKVSNLSKSFGPKIAVNKISFTVERGEVLGFLGPNGAGKSTSMRMLTGFIPPTSGSISVGGYDVLENPIPAKKMIGYLPENAPSYGDMTVKGFLRFSAELRGVQGRERKAAVDRVVEMCFLSPVYYQSVDTLSKGYRHRLCLAQALVHDPDVLVLDEPTDGLDPNQKHEVRTLIRRMGETKAIIFSTHILEEVDAACTRAIIIDRGQIVANGTPAELRQRSDSAGAVAVRVRGTDSSAVGEKLRQLSQAKKTLIVREEGPVVAARVYPKPNEANGNLARGIAEMAVKEGWTLEELHTEEGRLDEVFRSITLPETTEETRK